MCNMDKGFFRIINKLSCAEIFYENESLQIECLFCNKIFGTQFQNVIEHLEKHLQIKDFTKGKDSPHIDDIIFDNDDEVTEAEDQIDQNNLDDLNVINDTVSLTKTGPLSETNLDLLPDKSKKKYENEYDKFKKWRASKNITEISEDVLLAYFKELSSIYKSSTLWTYYSMLKATIFLDLRVDITTYLRLIAFLKWKSTNCHAKKSATFTLEQVNTFISKAPDKIYLATKVALIMGVTGACHATELKELKFQHIKDVRSTLLVHVFTKNKMPRKFIITDHYYKICKKYIDLRPPKVDSSAFFLNYINGKCTSQVIGIHKIGAMGKEIATYLKLPHPELYTGRCFKSSSNTRLVNSAADITVTALKKPGGGRSITVANGYIADSVNNKIKIDSIIKKPCTITSANTSSILPLTEAS